MKLVIGDLKKLNNWLINWLINSFPYIRMLFLENCVKGFCGVCVEFSFVNLLQI